jgi:hypothetical protein
VFEGALERGRRGTSLSKRGRNSRWERKKSVTMEGGRRESGRGLSM